MLIELLNKDRLDTDSLVYIENVGGWKIKLTNGSSVDLSDEEYLWLMTICGDLVEINSKLSISIFTIVFTQPNEQGILIFWNGEPPIQISKSEGEKLDIYIKERKQHIILSERMDYLISKNVTPEYKKLV